MKNEENQTLDSILSEVFRRRLYFTMNQGKSQSVNGYGTTVLILVEIVSKTDFCKRCETNQAHTRCSWETREKIEFSKEYKSLNKMINEVSEWLNNNKQIKSCQVVK